MVRGNPAERAMKAAPMTPDAVPDRTIWMQSDLLCSASFAALRDRGLHWLKSDQAFDGEPVLLYSAEMRYAGARGLG